MASIDPYAVGADSISAVPACHTRKHDPCITPSVPAHTVRTEVFL